MDSLPITPEGGEEITYNKETQARQLLRQISRRNMNIAEGSIVVLCSNQLNLENVKHDALTGEVMQHTDTDISHTDQCMCPVQRKRSESNAAMRRSKIRKSEIMKGFPEKISEKNIQQFLDSFDNVISDCDGVLWRGGQPIEGSLEMIQKFIELGKKVFYITNDCNSTRAEIAKKAFKMGFPGKEDSVMNPTYAMTEYLQRRGFNQKVYVVGMPGIAHELDDQDIAHDKVAPEPTAEEQYDMNGLMSEIKLDPDVGAVVIGLDPHVSMCKLSKAASYVHKDNDCLFLSMAVDENNAEMNNPVIMLGVGAIAKCVETAAGREPTIIGKPSNTMFDILSETHNIDPSRTLMMGDRCNSDIIFGKNCGLHTLVLLSGFTKFELLEKYASDPCPEQKRFLADYYANKLGDLLSLIEKRYY